MKSINSFTILARACGWTTSPARLLDNGRLRRYIDEFSVTGLTSNPTIFDHAIGNTDAYDDSIRDKAKAGQSGEGLFMELALEDLRRAADLFRPVYRRHRWRRWLGLDGAVAAAGQRHGTQHRGGGADLPAGRPAQPVRQDSRVRPKAFRRSRNRSSPACRSM